jgi:SWI/SNF-related matrix-associated actin-dependent regulator of chromatin subfamily A member 5
MGLGKTLQTLALFAYIAQRSPTSIDPHLVICPLSVLSSWMSEAQHWVPSLRTLRFHGSGAERTRLKTSGVFDSGEVDIVITTYEAYVAEDTWFKSRRWHYCVLDEGHRIRNAETNQSMKLQGISATHRLSKFI